MAMIEGKVLAVLLSQVFCHYNVLLVEPTVMGSGELAVMEGQ